MVLRRVYMLISVIMLECYGTTEVHYTSIQSQPKTKASETKLGASFKHNLPRTPRSMSTLPILDDDAEPVSPPTCPSNANHYAPPVRIREFA